MMSRGIGGDGDEDEGMRDNDADCSSNSDDSRTRHRQQCHERNSYNSTPSHREPVATAIASSSHSLSQPRAEAPWRVMARAARRAPPPPSSRPRMAAYDITAVAQALMQWRRGDADHLAGRETIVCTGRRAAGSSPEPPSARLYARSVRRNCDATPRLTDRQAMPDATAARYVPPTRPAVAKARKTRPARIVTAPGTRAPRVGRRVERHRRASAPSAAPRTRPNGDARGQHAAAQHGEPRTNGVAGEAAHEDTQRILHGRVKRLTGAVGHRARVHVRAPHEQPARSS